MHPFSFYYCLRFERDIASTQDVSTQCMHSIDVRVDCRHGSCTVMCHDVHSTTHTGIFVSRHSMCVCIAAARWYLVFISIDFVSIHSVQYGTLHHNQTLFVAVLHCIALHSIPFRCTPRHATPPHLPLHANLVFHGVLRRNELKNVVFQTAQIITNVRLVQDDVPRILQRLAVLRRLGGHPEPHGDVAHVEDDDTRVLRNRFRHARQPLLGNVVSVQKGHLRRLLDPHLVACVLGQVFQGRHVQPKLPGLGELAHAGSHVQQAVAGYAGGRLHEGFADVVTAILHEPKAVPFVAPVDHLFDVLSDVFGEFEKERLGFFFCQRSHGCCVVLCCLLLCCLPLHVLQIRSTARLPSACFVP
mmetsp:Transcript_25275/g.53808  ORF Transcript_25275/g.53808 Transcript_25275/m.53808 type:complete len:358 (+) Transcript_25275:100-1173(+)